MDRDLAISQLEHTSWLVKDGVPPGAFQLEQTRDGWIWIAGPAGLYRFDGMQFERVPLPSQSGSDAPSIYLLEAGPSGELWIAPSAGGLIRLEGAATEQFGPQSGLDDTKITALQCAEGNTAWAATNDAIFFFDGRHWTRYGNASGLNLTGIFSIRLDDAGTLWAFDPEKVQYLRRGSSHFMTLAEPMPFDGGSTQLIDGKVWLVNDQYAIRMKDSANDDGVKPQPAQKTIAIRRSHSSHLVDKDNNLWSVYCPAGLCRTVLPQKMLGSSVNIPRSIEAFARIDGLSHDIGRNILEDRNGSIWVLTALGLDRFRRTDLVPALLPPASTGFALALGDRGGTTIAAYSPKGNTLWDADGASLEQASPGAMITAAHRTRSGDLWLGGQAALWRRQQGQWIKVAAPPLDSIGPSLAEVVAIDSDSNGIWACFAGTGLFQYSGTSWRRFEGRAGGPAPTFVLVDNSNRTWVTYPDASIIVADAAGKVTKRFDRGNGIDVGPIRTLSAGRNIAISGDSGVDLLIGDRFFRMVFADPDVGLGVSGIAQTDRGDIWLNGRKGAVLVSADEVRKLQLSPTSRVSFRLFNVLDGYPVSATAGRPRPSTIVDGKQRVWLAGISGVSSFDPQRARRPLNSTHVVLRALTAGNNHYPVALPVELPEMTRSLAIDFTSIGGLYPERDAFSYKLEGVDADWTDASDKREARYTGLTPGTYQFRVRSLAEDGQWVDAERAVAFSIRPTFFQTRVFDVALVFAVAAALGALATARTRKAEARVRQTLQDRLDERGRIARELHDTLLQGMQGLIVRFQVIANQFSGQHPTRRDMEQTLDKAQKALVEVRDRVTSLRESATTSESLESQIQLVAMEMKSEYDAQFRLLVRGTAWRFDHGIQTEILRIATEGLANAFQHASAALVETELRYGLLSFQLVVQDDGVGIDAEVVRSGKPGHWGIYGMRERASLIGASLRIVKRPRSGTRLEFTIPRLRARARARA